MADFCEGRDNKDTCRHPRDWFAAFIADPDFAATLGHNACWVGMSTRDDFGDNFGFSHRGQACQIGCVSCADLPTELESSRAPIDGTRWMWPHPTLASVDATGRKSPLRADRINLIPRTATHYLMGHCFDNGGTECFHESVCGCFGLRSGDSGIIRDDGTLNQAGCFPSPGGRLFAKGFFANEFVYQDMKFPPRATELGLSVIEGMFCRPFVTQQQDGTPGDEDLWVGMEGGELYSPAWLRDAYRGPFPKHTCVVNAMVRCVAGVPNSDCSDAFANAWVVQPSGRRPSFYNASSSRFFFTTIRIGGDPHFRATRNKFDGLSARDLAHIKAKNEVVKRVLAGTFPAPGGRSGSLDQVDHEFDYGVNQDGIGSTDRLNTWSRSWNAATEPPTALADLPMVSGFPVVGRWVNLPGAAPVPADLVITSVSSELWLMPVNIRRGNVRQLEKKVEFHARYRLRVKLGLRINVEAGAQTVTLDQPWLPESHPDRSTEVVISYGGGLEPPTVDRRDLGVRLVMEDAEGTPVDLPTSVEWLGYLGQVSTPQAALSRYDYRGSDLIFGVLEGARDLEIPGWPFAHGTTKNDPVTKRDAAQIHGGVLRIGFIYPGG